MTKIACDLGLNERSKSTVFIKKVKDSFSLDGRVKEILNQLNWKKYVKKDSIVVIKPNLSTVKPEYVSSANTSPSLIRAVCSVLISRADKVVIGESPGLNYPMEQAAALTKIYDIAKDIGLEVLNFSKDKQILIKSGILAGWALPKTLMEANCFITLPKLKTHGLTVFTGSIKNQFGCIPKRDRILLHNKLGPVLMELNRILNPSFSIMDGIIAMEGRGPVSGNPLDLGLLLASSDIVALDSTAARMIGIDPYSVEHIKLCSEHGLGQMDRDEISIVSDINISKIQRFKLPNDDLVNRTIKFIFKSATLTRVTMTTPLFSYLKRAGLFIRNFEEHVENFR